MIETLTVICKVCRKFMHGSARIGGRDAHSVDDKTSTCWKCWERTRFSGDENPSICLGED